MHNLSHLGQEKPTQLAMLLTQETLLALKDYNSLRATAKVVNKLGINIEKTSSIFLLKWGFILGSQENQSKE